MTIELRMRDVHSLKAKRQRLKRMTARLRDAYPVAVAEIDHHDQWQRTTIGVGIVSPHASQLDIATHNVTRFFDEYDGVEVLAVEVSHLEEPGA